jgi:hypothetical protein
VSGTAPRSCGGLGKKRPGRQSPWMRCVHAATRPGRKRDSAARGGRRKRFEGFSGSFTRARRGEDVSGHWTDGFDARGLEIRKISRRPPNRVTAMAVAKDPNTTVHARYLLVVVARFRRGRRAFFLAIDRGRCDSRSSAIKSAFSFGPPSFSN